MLQRLAIDPMSGDEAQRTINRLYQTPADGARAYAQDRAGYGGVAPSSLARLSDVIIDTRMR